MNYLSQHTNVILTQVKKRKGRLIAPEASLDPLLGTVPPSSLNVAQSEIRKQIWSHHPHLTPALFPLNANLICNPDPLHSLASPGSPASYHSSLGPRQRGSETPSICGLSSSRSFPHQQVPGLNLSCPSQPANSCSPLRPQLQCHLLREAFPDFPD